MFKKVAVRKLLGSLRSFEEIDRNQIKHLFLDLFAAGTDTTSSTLIHSFDWKLEGGVKPEKMDTDDKFGITLQRAQPLRAVPVAI
ncbi:hypothetical protein QYF36_016066 [Acer negundo]|nr:hypothetical protein QYF36_016066 [Acer negundo]